MTRIMFGLPLSTVAIIAAASLFWIAYTLVYLYRTRDLED